MAFTEKSIDVQFQLANGEFNDGGNEALLQGLRVSVQALIAGAGSGRAFISIWGLPLSTMNQLSTVGKDFLRRYQNGISVRAGSASEGMTTIWTGFITDAFVDAQKMPDVCLRIMSTPGAWAALEPVPPTTILGGVRATDMMRTLAESMGFEYEDAGVDAVLSNPYYPGTAWKQLHDIARDAGAVIGVERGTVVVTPPGTPREGEPILISPQTGLVGYPAFNQAYVDLVALFDPNVKFQSRIRVESSLESACGEWIVNKLQYDLESVVPRGKWFMEMQGVSIGDTVA